MDKRTRTFLIIGLVVTALVAGVLSNLASSEPDGLERVAIDEGFDDSAADSAAADSPLSDYSVEGVDNEKVGTGLAGIIGVIVTMAVMVGLLYGVRALRRRNERAGT